MADVILRLGDIVFSDFEIPESIAIGGEQRLAVHRLVGGARIIDAMGTDDAPKEWSGMFLGENALDRAQSLDELRVAALPVDLTWSSLRYTVVIRRFIANFEAPFRIPYQIVCEVLEDDTGDEGASDVDDLIRGDMTAASSLSDTVGDSRLSGLMGTLSGAVSSVSSFAKATQSTIAGVLTPLNAARTQVQVLIASTENTLRNVTTVGGILPNNPLARSVASLSTQVNTHLTGTALYSLDSVLGRVGANLGQVNSSVKTVTVSGGNLFDLASKYYGNASGWTSIARANGISDPELSGITTLVIPANNNDTGGVLAS